MNTRPETTGAYPWSSHVHLILGAWLLAAPSTFGYASHAAAWSDWVSGAALILLAAVAALTASRPAWALATQWATALVGTWLLFAPLAFWAPAAAYANSLLVGTLAIVFSTLFPRVPLEQHASGSEIPDGWTYNPSARSQRTPIIAMAFVGFFLAQYMAAYQLGYHDVAWDPFFGDGTRRVLTSDVSKAFPVSDAGLGAFAYLIEALTGYAGSERRWRTMPWMVILFGVLVVPAGVISILLIILQPLAVGAWCALCLFTALTTLFMISPAADEVLATLQFLGRSRSEGRGFWRTFWKGGDAVQHEPIFGTDARPSLGMMTPDGDGFAAASEREPSWIASALGINRFSPTLSLCALLGVWLMVSPAILGTSGASADSSQLVGPLVITFSVIALSDIGRTARWINVPLGLWLVVAPWLLEGTTLASRVNDMAAGLLIVALTFPRGAITSRFGTFNRYIV